MTTSVNYNVVRKPLAERLELAACIYWELEPSFFKSDGKRDYSRENSECRNILFYLLKEDAELAYKDIARLYGFSVSSIWEGADKIGTTQWIYRKIAESIKSIRAIAGNLDARIVTVAVAIETYSEDTKKA